jgi:hypothetical protein
MAGPKGAGRDEKNIAWWQARASENSDGHKHRAAGKKLTSDTSVNFDPPKVPFTGEQKLRSTSAPRRGKGDDPRAEAKSQMHQRFESSYLAGVRRTTGG